MEPQARALSLVVPVYNEEDRLEPVLETLIDFVKAWGPGSELIFVDDGSTDTTVPLIEKAIWTRPADSAWVRVLQRPHLGKGAAVQAGILDATAPLVAFCDVDLATPLDDLARIVDVADHGAVAIGSRGLPASHLAVREHRLRELLGYTFNRATQLLIAPLISDTQCGAKAAPRDVWLDVLAHVRESGFAWDVDVIAQALALGVPVVEVPITWSHQPGSGVRIAHDGARMVAALPAIRRRARARRRADRRGARSSVSRDGVFDDANADALVQHDSTHWWFRSKAAYVNWALRRYAARSESEWLVDLGAGGAGVTSQLAWDASRTIAVEGNAVLAWSARAEHDVGVVRADIGAPPLRPRSADVVCLLDVIEHTSESVAMLHEARDALAPGGVCIVTVPAHQWLWSEADVVLGHHRRYDRRRLRSELMAAGFDIEYVGHVFTWLVPPVWMRRKLASDAAELGLETDGRVTSAAARVLTACERALLGRVSLPFGTSVLAVARTNLSPTLSS